MDVTLKKIIIVMIIIGMVNYLPLSDVHAMENRQEYLIFGAGIDNIDVASWNDYFKDRAINWMGYTLGYKGSKCIDGDFNNVDSLDSNLRDDFYDVIMFDWSTAKFIDWNDEILRVLYKKLKNDGMLLIPLETARIISVDPQNEAEVIKLINNYDGLKNWYFNTIYKERMLQRKLLDGQMAGLLRSSQIKIPNLGEWNKNFNEDIIHPYNLLLLKSVFGESSYVTKDYPIEKQRTSIQSGKSVKRNINMGDFYKVIKKVPVPIIDSFDNNFADFIKKFETVTNKDMGLVVEQKQPVIEPIVQSQIVPPINPKKTNILAQEDVAPNQALDILTNSLHNLAANLAGQTATTGLANTTVKSRKRLTKPYMEMREETE